MKNIYNIFINELISKIDDIEINKRLIITTETEKLTLTDFLKIINKTNLKASISDKLEKIEYFNIDENTDEISFMRELYLIRRGKNISLKDISEKINISRQTIYKYENNKTKIYIRQILKYIDALDIYLKIENTDTEHLIKSDKINHNNKNIKELIYKKIYDYLFINNDLINNHLLIEDNKLLKSLYIMAFDNLIISINNIDIKYNISEGGFKYINFYEEGRVLITNSLQRSFINKNKGIKFRLNNNDKVNVYMKDIDIIVKITQE